MRNVIKTSFLIYLLVFSISTVKAKDNLYFVGSTTVSPVIEATEQAFFEKTGITILVRGLGSSKGVKAAIEQTADVGMASRALKLKEADNHPYLKTVLIGYDALAFVANTDNPVDSLSIEQLQQIYTGQITDWKEILPNGDFSRIKSTNIRLVAKGTGHGTLDAFLSLMQFDKKPRTEDKEIFFRYKKEEKDRGIGAFMINWYNEALGEVKHVPNSIGFDSLGGFNKMMHRPIVKNIKFIKVDGQTPSIENSISGLYTLVRPLNLVMHPDKITPKVQQYLDFITSIEGQRIVLAHDYIPITADALVSSN